MEPEPTQKIADTRRDRAAGVRAAAFVLGLFAVTTAAVALVEAIGGDQLDGAPLYLVAVVLIALRFRTAGGLASAVAAFLVYNLLFTEPRFTLIVANLREWLNLLLFLFVAVVIGRLAGASAGRAAEAEARAREANALYAISRSLASRDLDASLPEVLRRLVSDAGMTRAWCVLEGGGLQRRVGDTGAGDPGPAPALVRMLRADRDAPTWLATHRGVAELGHRDGTAHWYRIALQAPPDEVGTLWATRDSDAPDPDPSETRLLALAADQLGQAIGRDRLREQAVTAEIARRDARLKSALVDSVSHDLRTPLAGIRAAAGGLADDTRDRSPDEVRATATLIEAETQRLDRMVGGLLDLSRIQAGAIRPNTEALDVEDAVRAAVVRLRPLLGERRVTLDIPADLPPVAADAVFLDQCVANVVENAARHTPSTASLVIRARSDGAPAGAPSMVRLVFEDDGPGLDPVAARQVFDRFHRGVGPAPGGGTGIGLTIVRGLAEAMGGAAEVGPSPTGGLAVRLQLPSMPPEPEASVHTAKADAPSEPPGSPATEDPGNAARSPGSAGVLP